MYETALTKATLHDIRGLELRGNQEFKSYLPTDTARKILHNEPILSSGGWSIPVKWKLPHYLDLPPKRVA